MPFLISISVQTGCGIHKPLDTLVSGTLCSGVKQQEHDTSYSPPPNTEAYNAHSFTSVLAIHVNGMMLITQMQLLPAYLQLSTRNLHFWLAGFHSDLTCYLFSHNIFI